MYITTVVLLLGRGVCSSQLINAYPATYTGMQGAKKVVSDSPGLVDFAIGLVNSVLNLPEGQAKIFSENSNYKSTVRQMF